MNTNEIAPTRIVVELISVPRRFRAVAPGDRVLIGLKRGGQVEGVVARAIPGALVIAPEDGEGADVIVIEAHAYGARVRRTEA